MRKRKRPMPEVSLSFLDVISCGFGAIVLLMLIAKTTVPSAFEAAEDLGGTVKDLQEQLFEMYGIPDAVRTTPGDGTRWLRYDSAEAKGMRFGAGYTGVAFSVGRNHRAGDVVWFGIDEDGRVVDVVAGQNTTQVERRLWPFGD